MASFRAPCDSGCAPTGAELLERRFVADVFEEVESELRADRYRSMVRRVLPWVLVLTLAVLAAFAGVWGYDTWRRNQAGKASETYAQALEAFAGNPARAEQLFRQVSESGSPVYEALALQQLAAMKVAANRPREAVPLFDQAAEASPEPGLEDAARLKAAMIVMDYAPIAEVERRLTPLIADGRPYRLAAREALGMARIAAGRPQDARRDFLVLSQDLDAPQATQSRAQAMMAAIDSGAAAQVRAILQASPAPALPTAPAAPAATGAAPATTAPAVAPTTAPAPAASTAAAPAASTASSPAR